MEQKAKIMMMEIHSGKGKKKTGKSRNLVEQVALGSNTNSLLTPHLIQMRTTWCTCRKRCPENVGAGPWRGSGCGDQEEEMGAVPKEIETGLRRVMAEESAVPQVERPFPD